MIPISNIYYLLAYAFGLMAFQGFRHFGQESFERSQDLLAALFFQSMLPYLSQGLPGKFVSHTNQTTSPHGKIHLEESIQQGLLAKRQLVCSQENFELDTLFVQVLKTTLEVLLKEDLSVLQQKKLQRLKPLFKGISSLNQDLSSIPWPLLRYGRRKREIALCNLCSLILEGALQAKQKGTHLLQEVLDEKSMAKLYEKFLLGYFQIEHPDLHPSSPQIRWSIQEGQDLFLPRMQTDVVLQKNNHVLILDAKYYTHLLQQNPFGQKETLHSAHLYQLFAYLKNWPAKADQQVDGLLLYAKSDQGIELDQWYSLQGHTLRVKTLDLNQPFENIARVLDEIAKF